MLKHTTGINSVLFIPDDDFLNRNRSYGLTLFLYYTRQYLGFILFFIFINVIYCFIRLFILLKMFVVLINYFYIQ